MFKKKNINVDCDIKKFCFRLHFYSSKAYDFMRSHITTLPHPSSLIRWSSNIDCSPGMFEDSFFYLERQCKDRNETLLCSLVFDEMAIKTAVEYLKGRFYGGINTGFDVKENSK